jgi:cytochrome c oxidase subunit 3
MFATLREKPWLDSPQATASGGNSTEMARKKIALRFFLAVVSVLFSLFIVTFLARSQFPDFEALAGQAWQPFTNATQLWINTGILVAASIAIQVALICARKNAIAYANAALIVAVIFTTVFLFAQLLVWQQLINLGYLVASNPANSYFYLFTAVHGLHLIGGLLVLARVIFRSRKTSTQTSLVISTSLCASYWHYLLVVWLLLFGLLTSTPTTYKTLAALCGF